MRFGAFTSEVRNAAGICLHAMRAVRYWQFEGASLNRCSRKTSGAATKKNLVIEDGTGPKKVEFQTACARPKGLLKDERSVTGDLI